MNLITTLGQRHFLDGLQQEEIRFLESVATLRHFDEEEILFAEDAIADDFHLVIDGRVGLEMTSPRHRPVVIQTMGRGDLVGLSWFFPPYRWSWRARAMDSTSTVAFDAVAVRTRCADDHNLSESMLRLVADQAVKRLHAARAQLLDVYERPR